MEGSKMEFLSLNDIEFVDSEGNPTNVPDIVDDPPALLIVRPQGFGIKQSTVIVHNPPPEMSSYTKMMEGKFMNLGEYAIYYPRQPRPIPNGYMKYRKHDQQSNLVESNITRDPVNTNDKINHTVGQPISHLGHNPNRQRPSSLSMPPEPYNCSSPINFPKPPFSFGRQISPFSTMKSHPDSIDQIFPSSPHSDKLSVGSPSQSIPLERLFSSSPQKESFPNTPSRSFPIERLFSSSPQSGDSICSPNQHIPLERLFSSSPQKDGLIINTPNRSFPIERLFSSSPQKDSLYANPPNRSFPIERLFSSPSQSDSFSSQTQHKPLDRSRFVPLSPHSDTLPVKSPNQSSTPFERLFPSTPPKGNLAVGPPKPIAPFKRVNSADKEAEIKDIWSDNSHPKSPSNAPNGVKMMNCSELENIILNKSNHEVDKGVSSMVSMFSPKLSLESPQVSAATERLRNHQIPGLIPGLPGLNGGTVLPPPGFTNVRSLLVELQMSSGYQPSPTFQSPQPWSPARNVIGTFKGEELLYVLKTLVLEHKNRPKQRLRRHILELLPPLIKKMSLEADYKEENETDENKLKKSGRKEQLEKNIMKKREAKQKKKTNSEKEKLGVPHSTDSVANDAPAKQIPKKESKSAEKNINIDDTGTDVTKNEKGEKAKEAKSKKKRKEKAKKEAKNQEETNKQSASKNKDVLKSGVFSAQILSENGDYQVNLIPTVPKENESPSKGKNDKSRKKNKKKQEQFEPYLSIEEVTSGLANKTLIEGEFRINQKNYLEAFISDPESGQDILILGLRDRNRALDGDIVVIQIKDEVDWIKMTSGSVQRTGKVVYVTDRVHHGHTVGTLKLRQKGVYMLISRDPRFPLLKIPSTSIPLHILSTLSDVKEENDKSKGESETDQPTLLYRAILVSWNIPQYANGVLKEVVGKRGDIESETAAIFMELGLKQSPISEAFHRYLPKLPYEITQEEIDRRLDLRDEIIFTIDPATAKDLDDAVSIKPLPDNFYEVGVHISDVSHFLAEGTPLDVEVSKRATTVYMVDRAYHMLPISLCALCSLLPGDDKLTISAIFKIDDEGNVVETKLTRSIINSCAQLSYDHAQAVIEGKDTEFPIVYNDVPLAKIKESILQLNRLAVKRRESRFQGGALKIDQPKVCFDLNSEYSPTNMFIYENKASHRMIEEFMLLANEEVAKFIHAKHPSIALLRRHDPPKAEMMVKLEASLKKVGIDLDLNCAGSLQQCLTKYWREDPLIGTVLNQLCAKPMNRAVYFCSTDADTHHYALNLDKYTHFTSPIRRFADIVVHRLLVAILGYTPIPSWNTDDVESFATTSNRKKYAAKKANDMSCNLFRALYIQKVGGMCAEAIITQVNSRSIDVTVPNMALQIRVYLDKLENVEKEFNDNDLDSTFTLKWPGIEEAQVLKVFSLVNIYLTSKMCSQVEASLLPPGATSLPAEMTPPPSPVKKVPSPPPPEQEEGGIESDLK